MKQTDQYKLNQWDPTDRILREDFNADNLKLDAALAGKIGKMKVLWTLPRGSHFGGGTTLAVLHMEQYEYSAIIAEFLPDDIDPSKTLEIKLGGKKTVTFPMQNFILLFFPHHNLASPYRCLLLCDKPQYITLDGTYEELLGVHLDCDDRSTTPDATRYYVGWQ